MIRPWPEAAHEPPTNGPGTPTNRLADGLTFVFMGLLCGWRRCGAVGSMRLVFGPPPPPDPRQVAEAQWALVEALEQAAGSSYLPADCQARRMAEELLRAVRDQATVPQQWAESLARSLLAIAAETLVNRQSLAAQHTQLEWLQGVCNRLQGQVDAHNADPLAVQVQELTADLTEAEADAARLADRVREIETALAGQAKTYAAEVARLEEQITSLNRIVGSQQQKLNDLLAPLG